MPWWVMNAHIFGKIQICRVSFVHTHRPIYSIASLTLAHYIFDFKTLFRWISQPYRRKNVSSGLGDRSMQCCCQPDKVFGCERTLQSCWQTCSRETEHKGECTYSAGGAASLTLLAEAARSVSEEGNSPPTIPLFTFQSCYFKWILSYFQCVTVYFSI